MRLRISPRGGTTVSGSSSMVMSRNEISALQLPWICSAILPLSAIPSSRSTHTAVAIGLLTLVISALGYFGAGLYALQSDPIDWTYVGVVYVGPLGLIGLGLVLRAFSQRLHRAGPSH